MYYLSNKSFWTMGGFFLIYFFIMGIYFPFFPIWLNDKNHTSPADTGIIFASISFFSLLFQPILGLLSDKLGLRKHLLWLITLMLIFFAPFFIYILTPLLKQNILLAAIVSGVYLGLVYNAGAPTIEAYIEKISRNHHFEFGRARLFGCVGWAMSATLVGFLFSINPEIVFWLGSASALLLAMLLAFAKASSKLTTIENKKQNSPFRIRMALELFSQAKIWYLTLFVIGVSCTYDVFDQQFANFFTSFFVDNQQGIRVFGYVTTLGELLNASIMFFAPCIVNRIGAKNALLLAGTIMSVRITGSAFAANIFQVIVLKILHMFEVPFLIVGCFKYITTQFAVRYSATIYLVCFCFFKQCAMIAMSILAGELYQKVGYHQAYLVLGLTALVFTLISVFTLSANPVNKLASKI